MKTVIVCSLIIGVCLVLIAVSSFYVLDMDASFAVQSQHK